MYGGSFKMDKSYKKKNKDSPDAEGLATESDRKKSAFKKRFQNN